jgi:hypothetical protein
LGFGISGALGIACATTSGFGGDDAGDVAPIVPNDSGAGFNDSQAPDGGCTPAEVLVVIDRSVSMAQMPDGTYPADTDAGLASAKWYQAIEALYTVSAPPMDQGIAFGVELFPLDPDTLDGGNPDAGHCSTLEQIVKASGIGLGTKDGGMPTNKQCMDSQIVVSPALDASAEIASAVDPLGTRLCYSTPIGSALENADAVLANDSFQGAKYVVLITDGQETCKGDPLTATQKLYADGIKTFVVGFGLEGSNGVDAYMLNNLACAGGTASDFSASCIQQGSGFISIATTPVYFAAQNGPALATALHTITGGVYCDPIK